MGGDLEEEGKDGRFGGPFLSMRAKVAVVGLSFFLVVSIVTYVKTPLLLAAIRGIAGIGDGEAPVPDDYGIHGIVWDGFDSMDPRWFWHCREFGSTCRSLNIRDGSLFLNLTEDVGSDALTKIWVNDGHEDRVGRWLFVNVEFRLRCSDDNGLESGVGKGMRFWGLLDNHPDFPTNGLIFRSESPESDPGLAGFQAYSKTDGGVTVFAKSLAGVDIREWHNYTILWRPGNATFLIDGKVVASTDQAPSTPLAIAIHMESSRWGSEGDIPQALGLYQSFLDLVDNQSIEVDHVRVFMGGEDYEGYSARVCGLIANASSLVEAADSLGLNTTAMRVDFASLSEDWNTAGYVHGETHMRVLAMMELWGRVEEMAGLFREASERIASAREMGYEDLRVLEAFYDKAGEAWDDYDYDRTGIMLETVIGWER